MCELICAPPLVTEIFNIKTYKLQLPFPENSFCSVPWFSGWWWISCFWLLTRSLWAHAKLQNRPNFFFGDWKSTIICKKMYQRLLTYLWCITSGGTVRLGTAQREGPGFNPQIGPRTSLLDCVEFAWVSILQSRSMHVRLIN